MNHGFNQVGEADEPRCQSGDDATGPPRLGEVKDFITIKDVESDS